MAPLMDLAQIYFWPLFRFVAVENRVALVVSRLADQPAEVASGINRVDDAKAPSGPEIERMLYLGIERLNLSTGSARFDHLLMRASSPSALRDTAGHSKSYRRPLPACHIMI